MAAKWEVIGQRDFEDLLPNGQFEEMVEVTYRLPREGVQGAIRLPKREFSVETVRDLIAQEAAVRAAVQELAE